MSFLKNKFVWLAIAGGVAWYLYDQHSRNASNVSPSGRVGDASGKFEGPAAGGLTLRPTGFIADYVRAQTVSNSPDQLMQYTV